MKRAIDLALFMTEGIEPTEALVSPAPGSETAADAPGEPPAAPAVDFENIKKNIKKGAKTTDDLPKKIEPLIEPTETVVTDEQKGGDQNPEPEPEAAEPPAISEEEKNNIKNQIDNARTDSKEKLNIVTSEEENLRILEYDYEFFIEHQSSPFFSIEKKNEMEKELEQVRKELEQANKELKLSEIFATMVDELGGNIEEQIPIVKEYNETLSTTDDITKKISLAEEFAKKIEAGKDLEEKEKIAREFKKNAKDSQIQFPEDTQIQFPEDAQIQFPEDAQIQFTEDTQIQFPEDAQIQSPEDIQDFFDGIDDNDESLTTTNDEQDLSAKTLGEKIANKISNYFSLREVKKRRESREKFFNDMKSNVKEFVLHKLHFEDAAEKVKKIKEKIKEKVNDLKEAASTFIKNKINLKKLIERGKKIVQNIAEKIGKSIKNAKLYFTDRVKYYKEKYNTKKAEYDKKIGELAGKRNAIYTKLNNAINTESNNAIDTESNNAIDTKLINTITEECLTSENVSLKKDKNKLINKIKKKRREKKEKLKKIKAQKKAAQKKAAEKKAIAGVKQDVENEINVVNTKKLKEDIKILKKERRRLKLTRFSINAVKLVGEVDQKTEQFLYEKNKEINGNQTNLKEKQEMLKKVRKAKLQKTFSNDKDKLQETLENLQRANKTLQSSVEVSNSNSLGV